MIKLTYFEGDALYIAPDRIIAVYDDISATTISCGGELFSVEEKPEEVVRKIMDYKLAMIEYRSKFQNNKSVADILWVMNKLAGLEQTP
jgi:uncharacterized protein YlzI (FlbEa/FlbD family)